MDPQVLMDVAVTVTKLKMYPYFDVAHYLLMCLSVRDDQQPPQHSHSHSQQQSAGAATPIFSRKHPLSCWVACIMTCFAGSIISNLILGEPCIAPLKNHRDIITASIVWYLVFYSPFDLVYKALRLRPVKMVVGGLKETQRAHKIYHGVTYTAKLYPQSYIVIVLIGAIKGSGSTLLKGFTRLVRGVWVPGSNELLQPSFTTKASLVAAIIFTLEKYHFIVAPHAMIYFGVVLFFVYFKLSSLFLGVHDPFMPFENLFCAVFMGGMWDALRRAVQREPGKGDRQNTELNNEIIKSKDEKKKD